jgi:hypothetical protein
VIRSQRSGLFTDRGPAKLCHPLDLVGKLEKT